MERVGAVKLGPVGSAGSVLQGLSASLLTAHVKGAGAPTNANNGSNTASSRARVRIAGDCRRRSESLWGGIWPAPHVDTKSEELGLRRGSEGELMGRFRIAMREARGPVAAACLAAVLAGCGWTSRDEFYSRHGVTVPSQPGDGSRLTSRAPDDPFRAQSGKVAAFTQDAR